jgi:ketosteroid isomerase-like protein
VRGLVFGVTGFATGLVVAGVVGSTVVARPGPGEDAKAAVTRADTEFAGALAARDLARFRSYLADEVVFFRPGLTRGGDAFVEGWKPMFEASGPQMTFGPIEADAAASGDLGYTIGTWQRRSSERQSHGHYVTIWKRQADGRFRAVVDIGTDE